MPDIPCDNETAEGRAPTAPLEIHLQSEEAFLGELLRLKLVAGYRSADLVEWYHYSKRVFAGRPRQHGNLAEITLALQLLDELGTLVFGTLRVTGRQRVGSQKWLLLSPPEQTLVEAWLTGVDTSTAEVITSDGGRTYDDAKNELDRHLGTVQTRLLTAGDDELRSLAESYPDTLDCRVGFTKIVNAIRFDCASWGGIDILLLFARNPDPATMELFARDPDPATIELARAFLDGVARFALSPPASPPNSQREVYSVRPTRRRDPDTPDRPKQRCDDPNVHPVAVGLPVYEEPFPDIARNERLSCELSVQFQSDFQQSTLLEEAHSNADLPGVKLFDLLFLCKSRDGWLWAFTKQQRQYLERTFIDKSQPIRREVFASTLATFRLNVAGIVKHLERIPLLADEVQDFKKETYCVVAAGYKLEPRRQYAEEFTEIEDLFPELRSSSYFYLHLSPYHQTRDKLPEGSLVAVFRIPRTAAMDPQKRPVLLSAMRTLVERWRAQVDSVKAIETAVKAIEAPLKRKVAEAAIMSRNLSHNIGSHALANSRFFESIGVLHLESQAPSTEQDDRAKEKTELTKGEIWRARTRLSTINGFLQGRMDFIARALGETPSHPEPMFFINDLLKGFMSETVLLNTLLSDRGYDCKNIEFHVELPGGKQTMVWTGTAHDKTLRHATFTLGEHCPFTDLLIAIPGGMTGRHAFYAFLENAMRNAAKYGAGASDATGGTPDKKFILHLQLRDNKRERYYELTVWDNLSRGGSKGSECHDSATIKIRRLLNQDIIDDLGKPQSEGHGIQEMKVCARFLGGAGRDPLAFPTDSQCLMAYGREEDDYAAYITENKAILEEQDREDKPNAWIATRTSLRCFDLDLPLNDAPPPGNAMTSPEPGCQKTESHLAFRMILQQPKLLGIVTNSEGLISSVTSVAAEPTVVSYGSIESLADNPAYFGLILANNYSEEVAISVIARIATRHISLPFRLMLVVPDEALRENWDKTIRQSIDSSKGGNWTKRLPDRRLRVVVCDQFFQDDAGSGWQVLPDLLSNATEFWKDTIVTIYDKWLEAFKGDELTKAYSQKQIPRGAWHLYIGFDRDGGGEIQRRWAAAQRFNSDLVVVHVRAQCEEVAASHTKLDAGSPPPCGAQIWLDNHGYARSNEPICAASAFYQVFGSGQIQLFQSLDTPPSDDFPFAFFLYSLVESSLLTCIVIDERVAEATIENSMVFGPMNRSFQNARIFPVYTLRAPNKTDGSARAHALSKRVADAVKTTESADEGPVVSPASMSLFEGEGAEITHDRAALRHGILDGMNLHLAGPDFPPLSPLREADCVIIHEGVTDDMDHEKAWIPDYAFRLFSVCPWIVRTSGRGSISRHLPKALPFLEFSELSDSTYRSLNKFSLGRAVLSLRGGAEKP